MTRHSSLVSSILILSALAAALQRPPSVMNWSETRKLTWDDFRMPLPEKHEHDAHLSVDIGNRRTWLCPSTRLHPTVTAFFNRDESWVNSAMKSDALLQHEQAHFDLAEVYARILRQKLENFRVPCQYGRSVINFRIDKIADDNKKEFNADNDRYEFETQHGLNETKQREWEKKINAQLRPSSAP